MVPKMNGRNRCEILNWTLIAGSSGLASTLVTQLENAKMAREDKQQGESVHG